MDEQKVALARGCSQKISSDGKLQFVDPNVASAHDVGGDSSLTIPKKSEAMGEVSSDSARVTKLRRPTRWGTPTNSSAATIPSSIKTASIPLPVGPPAHMPRLSSEVIPRHNSLQPNTTKKKFPQPSALNTSPSTSYSLNAFAPPLGSSQPGLTSLTNQSLTSLSTQANLSLPQLSTALSHQQVLQLQPNLLPSFAVVQPPFGFGVSNLLAAGLFGNGPLGPPISQPASMFLGNLPVGNQNQITTVPGFSSLQQSSLLQNSQIPVGGVPPPPPAVRVNETVAPISESLAVKIRQLAEATGVKTFDNCLKDDKKVEMDSKNSESGRKSGKSASAEDEEASETDRKLHKNGPNFELARVMLSRSLKKVYKRKQITKEEYKEIMKKGVTALSQRSKLDPVKVEEYAKKYVECIVHRRKKKH
ncbi:hypothetical protein AB6A40_006103 [Gnathostoma spinigerum]|uniref:SFR19-like C-terminal domain-containing protein n=1 Tax=Gnathostoma spinigerum TaxID=75299 RepID=A0ABD6EHD8_9BILA